MNTVTRWIVTAAALVLSFVLGFAASHLPKVQPVEEREEDTYAWCALSNALDWGVTLASVKLEEPGLEPSTVAAMESTYVVELMVATAYIDQGADPSRVRAASASLYRRDPVAKVLQLVDLLLSKEYAIRCSSAEEEQERKDQMTKLRQYRERLVTELESRGHPVPPNKDGPEP